MLHAGTGAYPGCWGGISVEDWVVASSRVETIEWASKEHVDGMSHDTSVVRYEIKYFCTSCSWGWPWE